MSEPEPDIAVARGARRDYGREHPAHPVLVVEVSVSSLALDRSHKGSLYARARLEDYWILNIVDRVLEVYRQPAVDASAPSAGAMRRGRRWAPTRSSPRSPRRTPPSPSPRSFRSRRPR
jgi:Uma2 family endonuclease